MSDPRCEQLDEYLCGWLSPDEAADFEAHLAGCAACQEESALQRQIDRLLAEGTAPIEPVPIALVHRVEHNVRIARRRRQFGWASALTAAAGIVLAVSLWGAQNVLLPRDDGRPIAQRLAVPDTMAKQPVPQEESPPLQWGGVRPESPAIQARSEPTPVTPVRVTLVDPSSAILVPVESHSPNVTLVCVYPTEKTSQTDD